MKEVFDAFQPKPLTVGLLTQEHKSILLDNYKESVVKILLPSTKYQCEYDLWFINKCLDYCKEYVKSKQVELAGKL
jgi:predicted unusual protein kinase regulating ubiquinone biosynthesis (AarF/ABC1/UbiB family)